MTKFFGPLEQQQLQDHVALDEVLDSDEDETKDENSIDTRTDSGGRSAAKCPKPLS